MEPPGAELRPAYRDSGNFAPCLVTVPKVPLASVVFRAHLNVGVGDDHLVVQFVPCEKMNNNYPNSRPQVGATFYPGGVDDFIMPEVISPAPQR